MQLRDWVFAAWLGAGACLLGAVTVAPAAAQPSAERSHWGVAAGFVPSWSTPPAAGFLIDADEFVLAGAEFRVGFVRGRTLSGDWGVSFVRKTLASDTSFKRDFGESCYGSSGTGLNCSRDWSAYRASGVTLAGIEVHKFVPFGTIARRVQIGLNFAGGAAWAQGALERHDYVSEYVLTISSVSDPGTRGPETTREVGVGSAEFGEVLQGGFKTIPLGKLELAVAAILAPGVKVRVSGGLNFPGAHQVAITGIYLFGARGSAASRSIANFPSTNNRP